MNQCVLCNIIETGNNNNEFEKNIILYEDDLIIITQATGSPIKGYIMIVPKKHINGFAQFSPKELQYVEKIINTIKNFYKNHFNINSILLEHGSTKNGRHPQSIVHAHLHIIPFNFNEKIEKNLLKTLKLQKISSFLDIKANEKLDYWFYCDAQGQYYASSNIVDVPRSIFMNSIAEQLKLPLPYEWRKSVTKKEYLDEIKELFNTNRKLLDSIKNNKI